MAGKQSDSYQMAQFVNILTKLEDKSDVLWVIRYINFYKTFLPSDKNPLSHKELKMSILDSDVVRAIEELEEEANATDKKRTQSKIKSILNEVGYSRSLTTIRWLAYLVVKILRKTLKGIYVNEPKLLMLKKSMGSVPVVLVPTHRSYGDFILMAFLCFFYGIEIPCVAAGLDFLSMWVMGEILRKTKAFFIRRTFQNDKIYKMIFAQYVSTLLAHGDSPVEFFIEGTRSRTGKSLTPKYGFLSMILKPYLNGQVPDIHLVPVSITYDRFLEEWLYTRELLGTPKPKESTKGLLKVFTILNENYGNVYFNFGDPISVRDWIRRDEEGSKAQQYSRDLKLMASHVIESHAKLQVLGATHLVMAILYNNLIMYNKTELSIHSVRKKLNILLSVLHARGVNVHLSRGDLDEDISFACSVNPNLIGIQGDLLHFYGRKGNSDILDVNNCVLLLLYVNSITSAFFCPALLLVLINVEGHVFNSDLLGAFNFLCELFEYEFPISCCSLEKNFSNSKQFLIDTNCIIYCGIDGRFKLSTNVAVIELLLFMLQPYLQGYGLLCQYLLKSSDGESSLSRKSLTTMCVQHLNGLYSSKSLDLPFCLTKSFSSTYVTALEKMGCLFSVEGNAGETTMLVVLDRLELLSSLLSSLNYDSWHHSPLKARL